MEVTGCAVGVIDDIPLLGWADGGGVEPRPEFVFRPQLSGLLWKVRGLLSQRSEVLIEYLGSLLVTSSSWGLHCVGA